MRTMKVKIPGNRNKLWEKQGSMSHETISVNDDLFLPNLLLCHMFFSGSKHGNHPMKPFPLCAAGKIIMRRRMYTKGIICFDILSCCPSATTKQTAIRNRKAVRNSFLREFIFRSSINCCITPCHLKLLK